MANRYLVIYSEGAGSRKRGNSCETIQAFFAERSLPCTIVTFNRSLQTVEALNLQATDADRLLIAGGDGTVRSVVEYLLLNNIRIPIGILPIGSANVLARVLGIPLALEQALHHAVQATPHPLEVGMLNGQHAFLLSACFGQFASITLDAEAFHKNTFGMWAYVFAALRHIVLFPRKSICLHIDDHDEHRTLAHSAFVMLHAPARAIVPQLGISNEPLHALVFFNRTIVGFLRMLGELYVLKLPRSSRMQHLPAERITLHTDSHTPLHLDGDRIRLQEETASYFIEVKDVIECLY